VQCDIATSQGCASDINHLHLCTLADINFRTRDTRPCDQPWLVLIESFLAFWESSRETLPTQVVTMGGFHNVRRYDRCLAQLLAKTVLYGNLTSSTR
jgi:hypothetical protein